MTDIESFLRFAKTAALAAGEAILEVYSSNNFETRLKTDQSPLTRADNAAHGVIVSHLQQTALPILSEEGRFIPFEERKRWDWFWLIDPLDGTKEFINRNGEFTVNIALIHLNVPVAGVIYAPCLNTLYYGSQEMGVFKVKEREQEQLTSLEKKRSVDELHQKEQVKVVASKSHLNEETKRFIDQFHNARFSSIGSSLKLMLLAEGAADIYPRLAPTMEWDTAAGHALLRPLNMGVYHTDSCTELFYNKEDLLNPSFIAL